MTSFQFLLSLPIFAMVLLSFVVLLMLGLRRTQAVKAQSINASFYKLFRGNSEPEKLLQLSRNLTNLFEMPVLFYLGIFLTIISGIEFEPLLYLAWSYVLLRYIHSYIHCTSNRMRHRFRIFAISIAVLAGYWVTLFIQILNLD